MLKRSLVVLIAIIAASLSGAVQVSAQSAAVDYVIGPQDVVAIVVFDEAELSGKYAVEIDGSFVFPYIGRVNAAGLTIRGLETEITNRLSKGFFKKPEVAASVESYRSQRVFVIGEVKSPGTYPLTGELPLLDAIAKAGFTTADASDEVIVVRGGTGAGPAIAPTGPEAAEGQETLTVNLKRLRNVPGSPENIALRDGDTVYVGRAEPIYVYGQVKNPGSYLLRADTTVLQALSLAGGATPIAAVNRIRIIRIVKDEKKELRVALTDRVEAGDTLMVPERFF